MSKELAANTTLSHYRLVSKIGEGGMGEVYLAQDTKLDRKVALKILPAELVGHQDRMRRFVQEAKAAAALNHPNIAHIYEIGESDGTHYIAMEFIDGVTLRETIHRDGASLPKLLKYLIQVAEGLTKAHAAGIVHRDLKPDNIMITRDDYAKVLDFGLAKLVEPQKSFGSNQSGSSQIATAMMQQPGGQESIAGMVMGTVGYMSPEQASGRVHEIDHRSDIFSFGCILFEAATGQKAFEGKDALDSLHKIVHAPTPQLKDVNPLAPDDLQRVVRRCLAKEADKRYQSMKEVAIEIDDLQQVLKSQTGLEYTSQLKSSASAATSGAERSDEGFWVAVLPFNALGSSVELETLASGLTEQIVTGLLRFSYLRVLARGSTLKYANESGEVREIGKKLGARYVMEGSIRQAGSTVRLAVQLVDATSGAHLWAETYDRQFQADQIFDLQDELVPRIVSTCADHFGVLARSISDAVRRKDPTQLSPYEALMRGFGYHYRLNSEEHRSAREILEKAVAEAPNNADCWAMLSWTYSHEYGHGFNPKPGSLDRALAAARRAVDLAPSNHLAYQTLAVTLFFRKDKSGCLSAAERALALNPLDASNEAIFLITFIDDWERGCALIKRAIELNPYVPGWYRLILALNEYRKANYRAAVDEAVKANVRGTWSDIVLCGAYGQLGEPEAAGEGLQNLVAENFAESGRAILAKWFDAEFVEHLMDGLQKAGLEITANHAISASRAVRSEKAEATHSRSLSPTTSTPSLSTQASSAEFITGEIKKRKRGVAVALLLLLSGAIGLSYWIFGNRATGNKQIESIAVMPFVNESGNADVEYLSDGMTETLINSLSQLPDLNVKARSSVFRYKGKEIDPKKMASTLNVQAILIGRVIQRGDQLTLNLELIDAQTENLLWGNRYERKSSELVALQSEIARDVSNKLKTKLSGADAAKVEKNFTASAEAYQLFLKGRFYAIKRTAKDAKQAIEYYQQAVAIDPNYALAYAGLAEANWFLALYSYPQVNEVVPKARELALKAVELDNSLAEPHSILGVICNTYDRDFACMEREQKRAIELNPNYSESYRRYGLVLENVGRFEEARIAFKRALEIDPLSPVTNYEIAHLLFYERKYEESETQSKKNVELDPNFWYAHLQLFYVYRMKPDHALAVEELAKVQDARGEPDAAQLIRESFAGGDWQGFLRKITEQRARLKLYPYFVAGLFAELGEKDKAFAVLNEALETKDQHTAWMKVDPYMDPLRDDARFREVLKKAGFGE